MKPTDNLKPIDRLVIYVAIDFIMTGREHCEDITVFSALTRVMEAFGLKRTDFDYETVFATVETETTAMPGRDDPWETGELGRSAEHARLVHDPEEEELINRVILGQE